MVSRLQFLWLALLVAISVQLSQSQITRLREGVGSCLPVILDNFGNTTSFSRLGILPVTFVGVNGSSPYWLKVNRFNVVCESIGLTRNSVSSFSAIVEYDRDGFPGQRGNIVRNLIAQVTLDCRRDGIFYRLPHLGASGLELDTIQISRGSTRKDSDILGNFSTIMDRKCGLCVDSRVGSNVNNVTHCLACFAECNEGQMRCSGFGANQCCNWFNNNICVKTCPGVMIGDPVSFDCGCGPLNVANGVVIYTNKFLVGSTATLLCNYGYVLLSPGSSTCTASGWVGNIPTCTLFDCGLDDISTPENWALFYNTTTFGSVVTFECFDNFALLGEYERTCQLTGWSNSNPTCVFDCGLDGISKPEDGVLSYNTTTFGSVATFECFHNFSLLGESKRTCQLTGWSNSNPTCVFDCGIDGISNPEDGTLSYNTTTFGSVVTFECFDNFSLLGESGRTCLLTGWSNSNPTCVFNCSLDGISKPEDGTLSYNTTTFGSVVTFECFDNFVLLGESERTCQLTGWSKSNPTCGLPETTVLTGPSKKSCDKFCIIGIVATIFGIFVLVSITLGVAYGIYSYLNHPNTKIPMFSATDSTNNLNSDNPLYLDPETKVPNPTYMKYEEEAL